MFRNIPLLLGEYIVTERPEGYYFLNRYYKNEEVSFDYAREWQGYFDELLPNYAFVENIYRIKKECLEDSGKPEEFQWGFTIKKKWADALGISINPKMEVIEKTKSIYTIIEVEDGDRFMPQIMNPAVEYMKRNGYIINGDIFGNLVAVAQKEGKRVRYMEVWIPIME